MLLLRAARKIRHAESGELANCLLDHVSGSEMNPAQMAQRKYGCTLNTGLP
jgi:hypothetical protein